ncbi:DNA-binding transcriptional regulator [Pantoea sp. FN060301]|uniref:DNA-binding transcriptional regulator n=1 Tax=Pantoea sp. FN060301 TaxID=3420380 RepID=UPI003D1625E7
MMHCPLCQNASHARSSRYISKETKERYHQCQNINCGCTFKSHESIAGIIMQPGQVTKAPPHPERGQSQLPWL